jgi:hypothetical protein
MATAKAALAKALHATRSRRPAAAPAAADVRHRGRARAGVLLAALLLFALPATSLRTPAAAPGGCGAAPP